MRYLADIQEDLPPEDQNPVFNRRTRANPEKTDIFTPQFMEDIREGKTIPMYVRKAVRSDDRDLGEQSDYEIASLSISLMDSNYRPSQVRRLLGEENISETVVEDLDKFYDILEGRESSLERRIEPGEDLTSYLEDVRDSYGGLPPGLPEAGVEHGMLSQHDLESIGIMNLDETADFGGKANPVSDRERYTAEAV